MANERTIKLAGFQQRAHAKQLIDSAPQGYFVKISEPTRSLEQNALMWPLLKDVMDQVPGFSEFTGDDIKLRFLNLLGKEMRYLPELEGPGFFPVGQRSSTLSKEQFSALLELIFSFGARNNVRWSLKSENTFSEMNIGVSNKGLPVSPKSAADIS